MEGEARILESRFASLSGRGHEREQGELGRTEGPRFGPPASFLLPMVGINNGERQLPVFYQLPYTFSW